MKLPNSERAHVPVEKISQYLLAEEHADGGSKAHFLRRMGFEITDVDILIDQFLGIAEMSDVVNSASSQFGMKYVLDGVIDGPFGIACSAPSGSS